MNERENKNERGQKQRLKNCESERGRRVIERCGCGKNGGGGGGGGAQKAKADTDIN